MIQASAATEYIATELNKLIQANQIKGKLKKSKSSVSIYLRTKDPNNPPPKYFRGSNHHPTLANLLGHNWKPWKSKNINIEFAEPRRDENGEKIENRWNDRVKQNAKGTIKPFGIDVYEYKAISLDEEDIPVIFGAIKVFVETGTYTDPFANTAKAARFIPRKANIIPRQPPTNISVDKNGNYIRANGWGADFVSENNRLNCNRNMNKKLIRLTESDLHRIVRESVNNVLTELDWKTYMNAARKRAERDGLVDNKGRLMGAAKDLEDWGEKQFFNKHNLNAPDGTYNFDDENAERSDGIEARARSGHGHMKFHQEDWDGRNQRGSYTMFDRQNGERAGGTKSKHYNDVNHFGTKVGKQANKLYNDMHNYYSAMPNMINKLGNGTVKVSSN